MYICRKKHRKKTKKIKKKKKKKKVKRENQHKPEEKKRTRRLWETIQNKEASHRILTTVVHKNTVCMYVGKKNLRMKSHEQFLIPNQ